MEPVFIKSLDMLKLLIIRHEAKLQSRGVYAHIGLRSKRIKVLEVLRGNFVSSGDVEKNKMLVIQQQIVADLQPHKKCSMIADGTYDSRKREATICDRGEPHIWPS